MEVHDLEAPMRPVPLVPDLSRAQKAMIHEQLAKTLVRTEVVSPPQLTKSGSSGDKNIAHESNEVVRVEGKTRRIGRKIRGLFMNDQSKPPSRQHSLDVRLDRDRRRVEEDEDEDALYRFDGRSKHNWVGSGI